MSPFATFTAPSARARLLLAFSLLAAALPSGRAAEMQGAAAVLRRLADPSAEPAKPDALAELKQGLRDLAANSSALPPDLAAARWLALFDSFVRIPEDQLYQDHDYASRPSVERLLQALPPVDAWGAVAQGLRARAKVAPGLRESALELLASLLDADPAARRAAAEAVSRALAADTRLRDYERRGFADTLRRVTDALDATGADSARVAAFERELAEREKPAPGFRHPPYLQVPDLVRLAGPETAAPLLARALRLPDLEHLRFAGEGTRRLAARVALENVAALPRPVWSLVASTDDLALYEAFAAKFPATSGADERRGAELVYLLGLIAADRTADAVALASDPARFERGYGTALGPVLSEMQRKGYGLQVHAFLADFLPGHPDSPFWPDFIRLSAQLGRAEAAIALLGAVLERPDLPAKTRRELAQHRGDALLAADRIDEGLALLRNLVRETLDSAASPAASPAVAATEDAEELSPELMEALQSAGRDPFGDPVAVALNNAIRLARVGRLLERPELLDEGVDSALRLFARLDARRNTYVAGELIDVLLDAGRAAEAEELAANGLAAARAAESRPGDYNALHWLHNLARVYHRAERPADVITLLDTVDFWGARDLARLNDSAGGQKSLPFITAASLHALGRDDEARPILRRLILDDPGSDAAYALLEKIGHPDYASILEQAARLDRFQERPLIWKARAQLAAGALADAEATIRAAIAIDPSDGEQGKGDRMRAYAVLGDILEKRGDKDQAALMHGAVAAIRLSENADDWWTAGLLARAVRLYEESLARFADAYCIQSRLALRYNELGDFAKAEEHYRRAFELMPDSFGRVESHCFGCEGAFEGALAQGVAERVFASLAAKLPDNPRVAYLFAYLRQSQERYAEAAELLRKAVALDPDYLNAWSKLQALADDTAIPQETRQAAALAILRLDPAGRHASPDTSELHDLRALWTAVRATEASLPRRDTGDLYPLAASQRRIEALGADERRELEMINRMREETPRLRELFSQHVLVNSTAQLVEQTLRR